MKMSNMKITLKLSEGLGAILSENPLDGLLAKLYFEKLKKEGRFDGDYFMKLPFLEMHKEGFYHISNPQYRVEGINNRTIYKNFDPDAYEEITQKSLPKTARDKGKGEYKSHITSNEFSYVKEVVFYCRGDKETVYALLHGLKYIGKKSAHGAGKVSSVVIEEIDEDCSIVCNGELMRPVPHNSAILSKIPYTAGARLMPLTHPYWDRGRETYVAVPHKGSGEVFKPNALTENPPKALAEVFGFDKNYVIEKKRKTTRITDNTTHKCKMCGRVQESGYIDPNNVFIKSNTNDFYRYIQPRSPFLCDYCHYTYNHYVKKMQKKLDRVYGDMTNILLFADRFETKRLNSDEKSELYDILKNPPNEPFAIIAKELVGGTATVNNAYSFLPTVEKGYLCFSYGAKNHFVSVDEVFECLDRGEEIFAYAKSKKLTLGEDALYNRSMEEKYNNFALKDDTLHEMMRDWFSRFDKSTRFVSKIVLKRYRKEKNKEKKDA